jgi:hypothetical protein
MSFNAINNDSAHTELSLADVIGQDLQQVSLTF